MTITITSSKILNNFWRSILSNEKISSELIKGNLLEFEETLIESFNALYDKTVAFIIEKVTQSSEYKENLKSYCKVHGLKKLSIRSCTLQIATGNYVRYESYYAEQVPQGYKLERSVSHLYWKSIEKASPVYISRVAQLSIMTPSFSIAKEVFENFGYSSEAERNRKICLSTGQLALKNRVPNMLLSQESLAGKRVIIGVDGGRTRTREWEENSESKYGKFDTPWREPKLLVISTIDKNGKTEKKELPIYDVCFGDDELFNLLKEYLAALQIEQAENVQFVGDGATWIWARAKPLLIELGVDENKITETLDYYHAVEHLKDLEVYLPKEEQSSAIKMLKDLLWKGDILKMKEVLSQLLPNLEESPLQPFQYFEKNQHRMKYEEYRNQKLPIGSGIVESGIRRVINLRFKCPSSFWNIENLEPLFYLRAAFLAGRWNNLILNITKN